MVIKACARAGDGEHTESDRVKEREGVVDTVEDRAGDDLSAG